MKPIIPILALCLSLACSLTTPVEEEPIPVESPVLVVSSVTPIPTPQTCIVSAHVLRLRTCGGLDCPVRDWLEQGEVLHVHQIADGWMQVTTPAQQSGWVNSHYCGGTQ